VTFSLYKDSEGGAPLWMETQNIQPDSRLASISWNYLASDISISEQALG
jgi:hypothetical protein